MKSFLILVIGLSLSISTLAHAEDAAVVLNGTAAESLMTALLMADLSTIDITVPDPYFPNSTDIVDQKIEVTDLSCSLSRQGVLGVALGTCTLKDSKGVAHTLGSAASSEIMAALPAGFSDGSTGRYSASASSISCEADARIMDSTGSAIKTCTLHR